MFPLHVRVTHLLMPASISVVWDCTCLVEHCMKTRVVQHSAVPIMLDTECAFCGNAFGAVLSTESYCMSRQLGVGYILIDVDDLTVLDNVWVMEWL